MKEYDRVKLLVERNEYAKHRVYKGMVGWICDARTIDNCRLVCFDECDYEYPIIAVRIPDLEVVWESHERQTGDKFILLSEEYSNVGLLKGFKGTLTAKLENNKWTVHFDKQEGLQQDCDLTLDGNDFILDR